MYILSAGGISQQHTNGSFSQNLSQKKIHTCLWLLCSRERKKSHITLQFSKGFSFHVACRQPLPNMQNITKETRNNSKSWYLLFVPGKGSKKPSRAIFFYLSTQLYVQTFSFIQGTASGVLLTFVPDPFQRTIIHESAFSSCRNWTGNCAIASIQVYVQSTVHCLSLLHPHLPVLTRYK